MAVHSLLFAKAVCLVFLGMILDLARNSHPLNNMYMYFAPAGNLWNL